MAVLIGETYLHLPSGELVVAVDHEFRRTKRRAAFTRTGRVVVHRARVHPWEHFLVPERTLGPVPRGACGGTGNPNP